MPLAIRGTRGRVQGAALIPGSSASPPPRPDGLPRTRSFRRARPARLWWLAFAVAVVANIAVVVALSQVSHLHHAPAQPPLAVRTLRRLEPDPPPPPPAQPREVAEAEPETAVPVSLPSLDLPAASPTSPLILPAMGAPDASFDLPMSIPAFTTIAPSDAPAAPNVGPVAGPPTFDTPAEREGAFDLDRYYPRAARLRAITGTTRIRITIDANGRVGDVQVLHSTPSGVFEQSAERLARGLRFRPAQAGGKPVVSVQDTTIEWTIR